MKKWGVEKEMERLSGNLMGERVKVAMVASAASKAASTVSDEKLPCTRWKEGNTSGKLRLRHSRAAVQPSG